MTRAAKRPWLALLLSVLMLITAITPAMAQTPEPTQADAIQFLRDYQIVQGDEFGNLNLDKTITRAELAKITVIGMGLGDLAPWLAPQVSFADSKGHWAAGYIETGARKGLIKGRNANTFDPNASITYAEAYTILLRMVGKEPAGPWNANQIMQTAASLGLVPNASLEYLAQAQAIRGPLFEGLYRTMTLVKLPDGKTLAAHFDSEPPSLTVSAPASTADETVTVTGTADGAWAVTVNGVAATLTGNRFTAVVPVQMGENTLTVVARDRAGNEAAQTVTVVRGGDVAAISISGPTSVKAGESVVLTVKPTDAQGRALPSSLLTATVADGMGSFNTATNTFKAGSKAGTATITFTAATGVTETYTVDVLGQAAEAAGLRVLPTSAIGVGKVGQVQVEVIDASGNRVSYDDGRQVTLTASGLSGVSISVPTVRTSGGVATFSISGSTIGTATLKATSAGLTSAEGTVTIATSTRVVLTASATSGTADGSSAITIRAQLQNESGNAVTAPEDIVVRLSVGSSSDSYLGVWDLIIRKGSSQSSTNGTLIPGYRSENVRVEGTVQSGQEYTVVPVTVSFKEIVIGPAAEFRVSASSKVYLDKGNGEATVTVRVVDAAGNLVDDKDYAFQVKVSTSNNEKLVDGLPDGLQVGMGDDFGLVPVVGAEDAIVGRTVDGRAELTLMYDKSGIVTIEVVGAKATDEAYDDEGEPDEAVAGTSLKSAKDEITFIGDVDGVEIRADVGSLKDQEFGAIAAQTGSRLTLKVYAIDAQGGRVVTLNSGKVTLTRDSGSEGATRIYGGDSSSADQATFDDGVATFTVRGTGTVGIDTYTATFDHDRDPATPDKEATFTIAAYDEEPDQPWIDVIVGSESEEPSKVLQSDDYMRIELLGVSGYGYVKVYRNGKSTPIYTSDILDLDDNPAVEVPVSVISSGWKYQVAVNNGVGDSIKSELYPDDSSGVVLEEPITIDISSVRYDAAAGDDDSATLTFTLSTGSNSAELDLEKIYLESRDTGEREDLSTLVDDCTISSRKVICTLSDGLDTAKFNGRVYLKTDDGWYYDPKTGKTAEADDDTSDNRVTPTAHVYYISVDEAKNQIYLNGINLNQGTINLSKLKVGDTPLSTSTTSSTSSTKWNITSKMPKGFDASELVGQVVKAESGWLTTSAKDKNEGIDEIKVYTEMDIDSVRYDGNNTITITGSGFAGGTVDLTALSIVDTQDKPIFDSLGAAEATIVSDTQIKIDISGLTWPEGKKVSSKVYLTSGNSSWFSWGFIDGAPLPNRYRLSWK